MDYITFKLKEKGELALDESGKIKGMDDKLAALKTQFPSQFESARNTRIIENRLPDMADQGHDTGEPKNLAEALKQQYDENAD